jgi:hypothetical protein
VQGRDRLVVKFIAEQLGLEGSYTPRTYIEQIQLERLVNEVMVREYPTPIMITSPAKVVLI